MEEWKEYKLGDLIKLSSGGTPDKKNDSYWGGAIPWISAKSMYDDYLYSSDLTITNEGLINGSRIAPVNSILLLTRGSGLFNRIPVCLVKKEMAFNQDVKCLESKNQDIVSNLFLFYWLMGNKHEISAILETTGIGAGKIDTERLKNIKINLPPVRTQKALVQFAESIMLKIEVNRRLNDNLALSFLLLTCFVLWLLKRINDNLEQQAQALFKSWLSHCSKMVTIGDLSLNITDYTKCEREEVVLINSSDVTEGHFEHHILSENKNLKGHFKKRFQKGDILYSQVRPRNRHWAFCTFDSDNYLASTQLMVIRNRPNVIPSILLYQYIIDDNVWLEFTLKTETRSGTFPQGNYEDLSSIRVPFGADTQSISASLERIYNLIYCNEDESRRLAQLRDTLLPRLMSGELKVNEIEMH